MCLYVCRDRIVYCIYLLNLFILYTLCTHEIRGYASSSFYKNLKPSFSFLNCFIENRRLFSLLGSFLKTPTFSIFYSIPLGVCSSWRVCSNWKGDGLVHQIFGTKVKEPKDKWCAYIPIRRRDPVTYLEGLVWGHRNLLGQSIPHQTLWRAAIPQVVERGPLFLCHTP